MHVLEEALDKAMQIVPTSPKMCLHYLEKFEVTD